MVRTRIIISNQNIEEMIYSRRPRSNSKMYPIWLAEQEAERVRPRSSTNWSTATNNIFTGLNLLRRALASGENAKLERRWNKDCEYPIKINPKAPWREQITKEFKHKVWVVVTYYNYPKVKIPIAVHVLNVLAYPLKFIPKKSVLRMPEYTLYDFRVGSVVHGFKVEFQIPKKFRFKD
jgi:hypothetical protein